MKEKMKTLFHNSTFQFWGRVAFDFVILLILVYLYSYSGINNSGFIYNEF